MPITQVHHRCQYLGPPFTQVHHTQRCNQGCIVISSFSSLSPGSQGCSWEKHSMTRKWWSIVTLHSFQHTPLLTTTLFLCADFSPQASAESDWSRGCSWIWGIFASKIYVDGFLEEIQTLGLDYRMFEETIQNTPQAQTTSLLSQSKCLFPLLHKVEGHVCLYPCFIYWSNIQATTVEVNYCRYWTTKLKNTPDAVALYQNPAYYKQE